MSIIKRSIDVLETELEKRLDNSQLTKTDDKTLFMMQTLAACEIADQLERLRTELQERERRNE